MPAPAPLAAPLITNTTAPPECERVVITIKPARTNTVDKPDPAEASVRDQAQKLEQRAKPPPRTSSIDSKTNEQSYVKNSSFLSRDIQAQKIKEPANFKIKPDSPVVKEPPEPAAESPPRKSILSPPKRQNTPPRSDVASPPKTEVPSPPKAQTASPPKKESNSPLAASFKIKRAEDPPAPKSIIKESSVIKEPPMPLKTDKLSLADNGAPLENEVKKSDANKPGDEAASGDPAGEESNGVGDKIKKFEKAAEDASIPAGRLSRPGSVRGRGRTERLESDPKEDLPPPATPFKDNVHFELGTLARQQSLSKNSPPLPKWPRENQVETKKAEPQKIIKPEFKPMPSPVDVTIRSPSLGVKIADQFPSHGTAFRNVASPAPETEVARAVHKFNEENALNFKPCKSKPKEKTYQVSKGSSYFTRGSEEIWLVKKKDIEEIEERVLDSFRRAGGNVCARSESLRPASDGGHAHGGHAHAHAHGGFAHATMGRKRQMYARSESLDPQWAGARAQTLKRQTSVACTCGHDKKTRAKSAGPGAAAAAAEPQPPRPRSRSHGDDNNQAVLDKYETLV